MGLFILFFVSRSTAQCPPNLGFENGDFSHWQCFEGQFDSIVRGKPVALTAPIKTRHTVFKAKDIPDKDPYGDFPVTCPNGSGYSIRLGNNAVEGQIDGASYSITIPADKDVYSIIYNYAAVFENPEHREEEQPKFSAKVFDVAANKYLDCSSFNFLASNDLPGFKLSTKPIAGNTKVYYKSWSPVTIKLVGYAGKTLRIEFAVNDCTLGAHFGYAYFDVNEDCSTPIAGNISCNGAASSLLVAPFGFKEYRWFNADFSKVLGNSNTLKLKPIPALNTPIAVEVKPFPGSGCVDTLYTTIQHSPVPFRFVTLDSAGACPPATVNLTDPSIVAGSDAGLRYSYYTDSTMNSYVETPKLIESPGLYYIKAANAEGCLDLKPVIVSLDSVPELTITDPPVFYYPNPADITLPSYVSSPFPGLVYDYWKDAATIIPVTDPRSIDSAGTYYIRANTPYGCAAIKPIHVVMQIPPPPNAFSPNNDGINDTWYIPGLGNYLECRIDIYDRFGRVVFHSIGYSQPWDGKANGKLLPVGTYYYIIKASPVLKPYSGSITIIR